MLAGTSGKVRGQILNVSGTHLGFRGSAQSGYRASRNEDRQTAHNLPEKVHFFAQDPGERWTCSHPAGNMRHVLLSHMLEAQLYPPPKLYIKSVMPSTLECVYI